MTTSRSTATATAATATTVPRPTSPAASVAAPAAALLDEQAFLDGLYERITTLVARHRDGLQAARAQLHDGTAQSRSERDAAAAWRVERLASLDVGDHPLCFGRLFFLEGTDLHVGRLALADDDHEPLVLDWRSPAAEPFYRATGVDPLGVARRRHIVTEHRQVLEVNDEILDIAALDDGADGRAPLSGDGALLAALARSRTAHMADIVATIQSDQDHIIRSSLVGVLVVNGGPGTGKTAVALHRAAYLLYTYRQRLANGVLVVGPNREFLRYISRVIPSLGEEDVALATPQSLVPGVTPSIEEPPAAAQLKGRLVMVDVIAKAVADRQRVPSRPHPVTVAQQRLSIDRSTLRRVRRAARSSGRTHNDAQSLVVRRLADDLVDQLEQRMLLGLDDAAFALGESDDSLDDALDDVVDRTRSGPGFTDAERAEARARVLRARDFKILIEQVWPVLLPGDLLEGLFGHDALLRSATAALDEAERGLLRRAASPRGVAAAWTDADVALLDEAAHLLGGPALAPVQDFSPPDDREAVRVAKEVLDMLDLDIPIDPQLIADRYGSGHTAAGLAEQALADPAWRFDHVIVDEAQELSPMQWRMVLRRTRSRSMTVVGDPNQASYDWVPSIDDTIAAFAGDRWRRSDLDVNYRTPAQVMEVAGAVLAEERPGATPPTSIRRGDVAPWHRRVPADSLPSVLGDELARRACEQPGARVAVIASGDRVVPLTAEIHEHLRATVVDERPPPVLVLSPAQAKGLEFDVVLLVEPSDLTVARGGTPGDLYVALTRCTSELGVVHSAELPAVLRGLDRRTGEDLDPSTTSA
jgi:DNA helicase IV